MGRYQICKIDEIPKRLSQ